MHLRMKMIVLEPILQTRSGDNGNEKRGGWGRHSPATPVMRVGHTVSGDEREASRSTKKGSETTEEEGEEPRARPASGHGSSADPYPRPPHAGCRERNKARVEAGEQRTHHGPNPQLSAPHSVRPRRVSTAFEPRTDHAVAHQKRLRMNGQPHLDKMRVIFIQNAGFVAAFSPFRRESVMLAAFRTKDKVTDLESGSCQATKE